MLKEIRPPRHPALNHSEPLPDPWSTPMTQKAIAADQISEEPHGLENQAESSDYLNLLPPHQAIAQDLLEDELKLKVNLSDTVKDGLEKALAFLYWLEMEECTAN